MQELKREKTVKEKQMEAALNQGRLYYRQLTGPDLDAACHLFRAMDRNGDNRVSVNEVIAFMTEKGMPNDDTRKVFEGMGLAGNHYLSIEDVVAFGYIFMVRPSCDRCRSIIFDMYYTCVACHDLWTNGQGAVTYDLCPVCFSSRDFLHQHSPFKQSFPGGGQGPDMSYNQGLPGMTRSFHGGGQGPAMSFNQGLQGIYGGWQGPAMSYNQGLPGLTTSFHGGGQWPAMSYNQGLQGIHGGWQEPAMSYNQGLPGMTTSFHGGGQGPAMSYNQGLPGMTTSFHGGGHGPAMSYNQGLPGMTTSFHGGGHGPAMSYNQGWPGMTTNFHGGGQGPAMSYNQGLPGMTTNFQGGGQGEGTQKFSKQKILQILANLSAVGTAVGASSVYIASQGGLAATAATLGCSIM